MYDEPCLMEAVMARDWEWFDSLIKFILFIVFIINIVFAIISSISSYGLILGTIISTIYVIITIPIITFVGYYFLFIMIPLLLFIAFIVVCFYFRDAVAIIVVLSITLYLLHFFVDKYNLKKKSKLDESKEIRDCSEV